MAWNCEPWIKTYHLLQKCERLKHSYSCAKLSKRLSGKFISRFPHTVYVEKTRFLSAYAPAKTANFDYCIIVILFLTLITAAGCVKKPFPKPTPQMNTDPSLWVKVLLLDNIKNCTIKVDYPFKITNYQNDKIILLLKSPPKP